MYFFASFAKNKQRKIVKHVNLYLWVLQVKKNVKLSQIYRKYCKFAQEYYRKPMKFQKKLIPSCPYKLLIANAIFTKFFVFKHSN